YFRFYNRKIASGFLNLQNLRAVNDMEKAPRFGPERGASRIIAEFQLAVSFLFTAQFGFSFAGIRVK
ncbi:MAG: hypothetical protein H6Q39_1345, partial [Chloroflexi bacterium]|nr:hypothetical protein [Chloroflexota bacterium]